MLRYFLLYLTAYPVSRRLMNTESGTMPLLNNKWTWLGMSAHAKQSVFVSGIKSESRFRKSFRSSSDRNIFLRSMPLMITWCSAPGASILAFRGITVLYHVTPKSMDVPIYPSNCFYFMAVMSVVLGGAESSRYPEESRTSPAKNTRHSYHGERGLYFMVPPTLSKRMWSWKRG